MKWYEADETLNAPDNEVFGDSKIADIIWFKNF